MANTELLSDINTTARTQNITKFQENDVAGWPWATNTATQYASTYSGDFPFMLDIQSKVWKNESLSPRQIAAVLNCALKEAKNLPDANKGFTLTVPDVPQHEFVQATNKPNVLVHKVTNTKTGDTFVYNGPDGSGSSLDEINAKMAAIQETLNKIEEEDVIGILASVVEDCDAEEQELFKKFQEAVDKIRAEKLAKRAELKSVEANVKELRLELSRLATEAEKNQNLIEAQKRLDEITEQLNNLRKDAPWNEAIRPFQWDDVCYIVAAFLEGKNGVLNANDMGLGKTFESVAVLWLMQQLFPEKYGYKPKVLWLTKKSLIQSSIREFRKWWPEITPIPVSGKPNQREFIVKLAINNNAPVVVNYDALNTTPILMTTQWDIIVMDEVHRLKGGANYNPTKVWENTSEIAARAKFIMPLSGSPIQNHPKDMWAYLYMLDPIRFPDHKTFVNQYCYGYDEGMTVQWDRLIKILSNRVIRKSKAEVLTELPDKTREFRYVEMLPEQQKIYNQLRDQFFFWLDEQEEEVLTATSILAQLTRLRQVALMPGSISIPITDKNGNTIERRVECNESAKIDEAMDIIEQLVQTGEQVVVFSSQFNAPLFEIQQRIEKEYRVRAETLTGANSKDVDKIEQAFKDGDIRVLCVNMKSGGEGLNLQTASHAIFLDLWWNPMSNMQAEDRLHRQGQKNAVTIHIIQAEDSVDKFIAEILDKKSSMIEGVMEDSTFRKEQGWKAYLSDLL